MKAKSFIASDRFHPDNTIPKDGWIWVFGSNEAGRHGKGAAKVAHVNFKAKYGVGRGPTGEAYAIATKDKHIQSRPFEAVSVEVQDFLAYAEQNPHLGFFVTRIGCVLAGFKDEQIAPLFAKAPLNCSLPEEWAPFIAATDTQKLAA